MLAHPDDRTVDPDERDSPCGGTQDPDPVAEPVDDADKPQDPNMAHVIGAEVEGPYERRWGAYWEHEGNEGVPRYIWTRSAWRNVLIKAAERREVRYDRYRAEQEERAAMRKMLRGWKRNLNIKPPGGAA